MFKVSCIQLCSSNNVDHNLKKTKKFFLKAVKQKTDFILTPEVSSKITLDKKKLLETQKKGLFRILLLTMMIFLKMMDLH